MGAFHITAGSHFDDVGKMGSFIARGIWVLVVVIVARSIKGSFARRTVMTLVTSLGYTATAAVDAREELASDRVGCLSWMVLLGDKFKLQ